MLTLSKVVLGLGTIALTSLSFAQSLDEIQTAIESDRNGFSISLPVDGSNCDPRVIAKNLKLIQAANVIKVTNLTPTAAAFGHCYGACQSDLQDALELHCQKADKLAEIAQLLN